MIDKEQENSDESPLASDASGHTSSSTKDNQPKKRTPPIVIDDQYNTPGLLLEISEVVGKKVMGKIFSGKLKVFPEDSDAHRKIQNFISVKKLKSHTYEMAGDKQLKTVIRGLLSDFDVDEIIQELGTHNITPEHVSVMRNRKQNKNMSLFLVVSRKCPANQAIFQITSIGYYKIKVEPLDKNTMPAQCYRCQLFYHHSRFCNREPKCLKCSQSHLTRDCTKKPDAPAKCANCGGPHPANFSGCEKNPKKLKPSKPPTKNVWHERAKAFEEKKIKKLKMKIKMKKLKIQAKTVASRFLKPRCLWSRCLR
ncbi:nucleic-acid-binding protein from transposon X-element [Trichonephila clavipes]|nr:nucleic-acid-binding protein from transposon X-element [Trichonephila clavipes]